MVCSKRLKQNFERIAEFSIKGQGITRLAFSDEDWQARSFVIELMKEAGLTVTTDAFGNVFGRREGLNPKASVVMLGSHVDSVPQGGNFDGVVGVLGAIEALKCINEEKVENYHPIEVAVFMSEESSRFGVATLGSKAFWGKLSKAQLKSLKDKQGISLAEALQKRGLSPENVGSVHRKNIKCFLELHIEQGKVLETKKIQLGIVEAIAAPSRFRVVIHGEADHSGATPMNMRQDALTAAAEAVLLVEKLAAEEAEYGTVGTTGIIKAEPGVMNVIPGKVELGVDIRGICLESKRRVIEIFRSGLDEIAMCRKVSIEIITLTDEQPVELSIRLTEILSGECQKLDLSSILMPSGAGHDAMHFAPHVPTGMLFIPCLKGISHNPAEYADIKDIAAGTEVLYAAILKVAQQDFSI
jgi:hydantoinase/carbamoylase family amidase